MDATTALLAAIAGLITALGSLGGAAVLFTKAKAERRKIEAERAKIEAETSTLAKREDLERVLRIVDQLQEDNERLRGRLNQSEARDTERDLEMMQMRTGIIILINQLRRLGVEPEWQPEWAARCAVKDVDEAA